jgi:predicted RNase H-like nuclease
MDKPEPASVAFLGLDLAWGTRNPSGALVLRPHARGYRAAEPETLGDDSSIIDWASRESAATLLAVLAIDAPLYAPNAPGTSRPADIVTSRLYGRFNASTHSANRERCARPIVFAADLENRGWNICPYALRDEVSIARKAGRQPRGRFVIEVYPHAACVGLFGLARIISYKKGRVARRRAGQAMLQDLLHERLPANDRSGWPTIEPFAPADVAPLRGRGLKAHEDRLDALLCAAMAAALLHAPDRCIIAGADNPAEARMGYIVVPRAPASL